MQIQLPPLPIDQVNVLLEALSYAPMPMAKTRGLHDLIFFEAKRQTQEVQQPAVSETPQRR